MQKRGIMSKLKKVRYFRSKIMVLSSQLEVLTEKIYESDNLLETAILAGLSNTLVKRISRFNEKIGILLKL